MEREETRSYETYTATTCDSTIRRRVDSLIGENLTCPCAIAGIADPGRHKGVASLARAASSDRAYRKNAHPIPVGCAFYTQMKRNTGQVSRGSHIMDFALAATEQMELYCVAHPGSPSAVRRPKLFVRGDLWIALLGPSVEEGIVGIGPTVTAALRAFDTQYLAGLRPSAEVLNDRRITRNGSFVPAR